MVNLLITIVIVVGGLLVCIGIACLLFEQIIMTDESKEIDRKEGRR